MVNQSKKVCSGVSLALVLGLVALMPSLKAFASPASGFLIYQGADATESSLGMVLTDVSRDGSVLLVKAGESKEVIPVRFATTRSAEDAAQDLANGQSLDLSGCAKKELINSHVSTVGRAGNFATIETVKSYTLTLDCDGLMGLMRAKVISAEASAVTIMDLSEKPVLKTVTSSQTVRTGGMELGKI